MSLWGHRQNTYGNTEGNKNVICICSGECSICIHVRWYGPQANPLVEGRCNQPLNELLEQHNGKPNLKWICECMVCTLF